MQQNISLTKTSILIIRSVLFEIIRVILTIFFSILALCIFFLPHKYRYRVIRMWAVILIEVCKNLCGISYRVIGRNNIPKSPTIILSNHQSAWETLAFQSIFPDQVWVLKRELLFIPFFGWGLAMTNPIAIDRGSGVNALHQTVRQGVDRLRKGFCIVMFPEGTRITPGQTKKHHIGGAFLSIKTGVAITPVAHNAGTLWGKNAIIKKPGEIIVSVGPQIQPHGLKPTELKQKVERWINKETNNLRMIKTKSHENK